MSTTTKLAIAVTAIAGLSFTAIGLGSQNEARATPAIKIQQSAPTITINPQGGNPYTFEPAQLEAKVGQQITVKNNDPNGIHSVTSKDRSSFNVDVPPGSSATFSVSKPGKYDYICTYHQTEHNPASVNVS